MTEQQTTYKRVRPRDPHTSWQAAAEQTEGKMAALQVLIHDVLSISSAGLTDDQLIERIEAAGYPCSPSGVRSRRAELVAAGWVIDSGLQRRSKAGRAATVWRVTTSSDRIAEPEPEIPTAVPDTAEGIIAQSDADTMRAIIHRALDRWADAERLERVLGITNQQERIVAEQARAGREMAETLRELHRIPMPLEVAAVLF